jgi:hypothetical protein
MLDPYQLTPNASINRVKIVTAPGLPPALSGKTAYELLGRHVIINEITKHFPELANLPDPFPEFERRYLVKIHPQGVTIAQRMGLCFAWLLFTLKRGEPENRAARPEWDDSYWTHWAGIERIIIGGGMVAGALGQRMIDYARFALGDLLALEIAQHAAILPMLGAALKTDTTASAALVFDFGGTAIKRGLVLYREKRLLRFPSIPVPQALEPVQLLAIIVDTIVDTWQPAQQHDLAPHITASIANYVQGCQLAEDTSYGRLRTLAGDSCKLIAADVSQKLGYTITLTLIHDGTAAAYVYAGAPKTAVITLGTALGVGFPLPTNTVHPVDQFSVQDVSASG